MKYYDADAVVLRRRNIGEADRIIVFYTRELGKISGVARGVRKIRSKLAGSLEPFIESRVRLVQGKSLDTVIGVAVKQHWHIPTDQLPVFSTAVLLLEMVDRLTPDNHPSSEIYDLLTESLAALEHVQSPSAAIITQHYFSFKLLAALGYLPEIPITEDHGLWLDLEHGQFGQKGSEIQSVSITQNTLKLWKLCQIGHLSDIMRVRDVENLSRQAQVALDRFYQYRFDIEFRASRFLEQ